MRAPVIVAVRPGPERTKRPRKGDNKMLVEARRKRKNAKRNYGSIDFGASFREAKLQMPIGIRFLKSEVLGSFAS